MDDIERILADADRGAMRLWQGLVPALAASPSAAWAHAPAAAGNTSDFGLMLAWSIAAEAWAQGRQRIGAVCDDPWLFRHLLMFPGAQAVADPPPLRLRLLGLSLRGVLGRLRVALSAAVASMSLRAQRRRFRPGLPALLVYGHPASDAQGYDGYFGKLMMRLPILQRVLHVDCGRSSATRLCTDGRTFSLHAWGSLRAALRLLTTRWRPSINRDLEPYCWLVRRAAALEGSTGLAAMIRWQEDCQRAWLKEARPTTICWPWEGHAWERDLVRQSRMLGVGTVGYQHSTVGSREWNHSPRSAADGIASFPDRILCSGQAWQDRLVGWGCPPERVEVGGAWRATQAGTIAHSAHGPIFVALPADLRIARAVFTAIREQRGAGFSFVVRDHPMAPFVFEADDHIRRAEGPLMTAGPLRAVLYAATTVGLEAVLAGLPTLRFQPDGMIPNDVLPDGVVIPTVTRSTLGQYLREPPPPRAVVRATVFSPVVDGAWESALGSPLLMDQAA